MAQPRLARRQTMRMLERRELGLLSGIASVPLIEDRFGRQPPRLRDFWPAPLVLLAQRLSSRSCFREVRQPVEFAQLSANQGRGGGMSIEEIRRRSTDEMLRHAMEESGNDDPKKVAANGSPLHYDSLNALGTHRAGARPTDDQAEKALGEAAAGKVAGAAVDGLVDKGVAAMATSALARGVVGACWQAASIGVLAYHLYTEGYEKPHREKDLQLSLGASDAGVVGLAQALPFDDGFKRAVASAHDGSATAAAGVAAALAKPEQQGELAELTLRADRGLLDAAYLARGAAPDIVKCLRGAADASTHAKAARARGDNVAAANFEERAAAAFTRAAELEKNALAPLLGHAHADAAYGLGVQSAMHHAISVELGTESGDHFNAAVTKARSQLAAADPPTVTVKG